MILISFLGDISLNDQYVKYYAEGHNPFSKIENILNNCDYVIGNLESIARGNDGENLLKTPRLATNTAALNYLINLHVNVVTLANNHVYDHLEDGFNKTILFLEQNNIKYLGASSDKTKASLPLIISENQHKIGLLNYVAKDTNPSIPPGARVYVNYYNLEKIIQDIKELKKKVDSVVILLHWGGQVEGGIFPDYDQPKIARRIIDAGADLIIGHHSHTFQSYEVYKSKYVFYSLGNFCMADILSDGKMKYVGHKKYCESAVVKISFSGKRYDVSVIPIKNTGSELILNKRFNYKLKSRRMMRIIFENRIISSIYKLKLKNINKVLNFMFYDKRSISEKYKTVINKLYIMR